MAEADHRTVALMDGVAVFWVVLWLVVGTATGVQIWQLSRISDTAEASAGAVASVGEALQDISDIPLVGDAPGELGAEVAAAAAEIEASAARTRRDVRRTSILLGASTFLIPISPVLGLYVPLRLRRRGHVATIRRELRTGDGGAAFDAYLAHRAVAALSYPQLLRVSADPAADLAQGRHGALADAELERLGLARVRR